MPAFEDVECPAVAVLPSWNTSKPTADGSAQTEEISFADCAVQSRQTAEIETQTEADEAKLDDETTFPTNESSWRPQQEIQSFVCRAAPEILAQLQQNLDSHAFDDFDVLLAEDQDEAVTKLHTLSYDFSFHVASGEAKEDEKIQLQCTGLSWNSTGSVLAVSYGRHDLSGWCDLPGALCTWNLFHRDFDPKTPTVVLDTSSCLMCVACHPEQPALVAAGSFNGEVYVWNTGAEEQLIACTQIDDYFHREPIASVAWVYNMHTRDYEVASISGDGTKLSYPTQGFRLARKASAAAGRFSAMGMKRGVAKREVVGGTAMAFGSGRFRISNSFVVGTEGGSIFRSSLSFSKVGKGAGTVSDADMPWNADAAAAVRRVPASEKSKVVRQVEREARDRAVREVTTAEVYAAKPDPSLLFPSPMDSAHGGGFKFEQHTGPVHALDASPFHRNLFLSCGADGDLKIFSMLQARPLFSLQPSLHYLFCAAWSRTRPLVLAAGAEDCHVHIYDFAQSQTQPVASLDCADDEPGARAANDGRSPVYALAFNPRQRDFLASGNGSGCVHVWKLSWRLANQVGAAEQAELERIASEAADVDDEN